MNTNNYTILQIHFDFNIKKYKNNEMQKEKGIDEVESSKVCTTHEKIYI